jgi:hypothetical protein
MGCQENEYLVNNPDRPDWMRKEALYNIIQQGCIDALRRLLNNPDRPDWMRNTALDAVCAFAHLGESLVSGSSLSIQAGGDAVTLSVVSVSVSSIASQATDCLFKLANNPDRPDWMRRMAVETLVDIRYSKYCLAIADNPDRPDWMRKLAMKGL